jgi:hypothetical protein
MLIVVSPYLLEYKVLVNVTEIGQEICVTRDRSHAIQAV